MPRSLSLLIVCLITLVAGCGNEEGSSEGSAKKPATMCEAVAPAVPEDWDLTKTAVGKSKAKTECTLAGEKGGTTLVVSLIKPESGSVADALKGVCEDYMGGPEDSDDKQCTRTGPMKLEGSPSEVQRAVRMDSPEGVLWVTFRTNDPDHAAGAEDMLADVEDAVSQ